ncbi:MAG TPA: hypothetical protein VJU77_16680 [Chthoniobacterales bacterium]|nr:hypothetical protein [Chthoniobacterales bacterium]
MKSIELLGLLLIGNSVAVCAWWLLANKPNVTAAVALSVLVVFIGLICIFHERITEITITQVGSIKTAARQATGDAEEISKIKERIEAQAATVDLVANKATEAERLARELGEKNELASKKLDTIEDTLKKASKTVDNLNELTAFTSIVLAAQNDDRKSFDQLHEWSKDAKYPLRDRASQAYEMILNASSKPFGVAYTVPWKRGVDPSKITFEGLKLAIADTPYKEGKFALLQYLESRQDIPMNDRFDYFASVMRSEASLGMVQIAGECFTHLAQLKIKPLAVEFLLEWWSENRDKADEDILKASESLNVENGAAPAPSPTSSRTPTPSPTSTPSRTPTPEKTSTPG